MSLLSLNVGLPKDVPWQGRTVHTGIWKSPVEGPRMVRTLNIDGDGQGDLAGHGGEQRAVLVYQIESYRHWQDHFGRADLEFGQFGENFTVDSLSDDEVCIGDRYRIGEAEFEVTQPRVTCFRVGLRFGEPELPALLVAHHRPGFYLRVLKEGQVQAGDDIVRTRVGPHALSVAAADALLYLPGRDIETLRAAVDIPALTPGWRQSFLELLQAAESGTATGTAPPIGVEPAWSGFRRLRVAEVVAESPTVASVYLTSESAEELPEFKPGQYITLRAAEADDPPPVRSYSLSARPGPGTYRISVKLEPHGTFSSYVHSQLRAGSILEVSAPHGEFVLTSDSKPVLLISAGIGVTPVLAMLRALANEPSERQVWWIHVTRDIRQYAFAGEANQLLTSLPHAHERLFSTSTEADPETTGSVIGGRPTLAALTEFGLPLDATAYICGPLRFMDDMRTMLVDLGIAPDRVRTELFGARPAITPGINEVQHVPHQPTGPEGTGPEITFARNGLTVRWSSSRLSLLELAEACDVPTQWSCRSGVCHTCVTPILSGDIAYAPTPLELPGSNEVLVCCAQPLTDLVLDL